MKQQRQSFKTTVIPTIAALIAFAGNSILGRMALGEQLIDAASFTTIRLLSGAVVLSILLALRNRKKSGIEGKASWFAASMLFLYALSFSFAYLKLDTGTGALILFGSVQITMILSALFSGNRLHKVEWIGVIMAFSGFIYLVLPGVTAPSLSGFSLMTGSGIAWGLYTLKGRSSVNPLSDTAHHFLRSLPFVLVLLAFTFQNTHISSEGIWLASLSGGLTSGIGYTLWYTALRGLSITQAAVLQLSVPIIAALGGVIFVSEAISLRLVISALFILGGIFVTIWWRYAFAPDPARNGRNHHLQKGGELKASGKQCSKSRPS